MLIAYGQEMTESKDEQKLGMPIYADPVIRKIVDAAGDEDQTGEWLPVNTPAKRICKCLEGLRDILENIEHYNAAHAPKKRRRRLRGVFVPLHALSVCIVDLINSIISEKTVHSVLPKNCLKELSELRIKFEILVPFKSGGKLGDLRNKVSGHYDKNMTPSEMRDLIKAVTSSEVGEWISICLGVLCDLIKLDVYRWSTKPTHENQGVILCERDIPILSEFVFDSEKETIIGLKNVFLTTSPRVEIGQVIKEVAVISDTLFVDGEKYKYRIRGFYDDPPDVSWSAVLRTLKYEKIDCLL